MIGSYSHSLLSRPRPERGIDYEVCATMEPGGSSHDDFVFVLRSSPSNIPLSFFGVPVPDFVGDAGGPPFTIPHMFDSRGFIVL